MVTSYRINIVAHKGNWSDTGAVLIPPSIDPVFDASDDIKKTVVFRFLLCGERTTDMREQKNSDDALFNAVCIFSYTSLYCI